MESLQHSGNSDDNHDTLIISVITIFSTLSFTALLLRLAAKRIKRSSLYWDDYLAIVSWVCVLRTKLKHS